MECLLSIKIPKLVTDIMGVLHNIVGTYWHSLVICILIVSCAMALSYFPSALSNKIRRDGVLLEKGILYTLLWIPACPIIGIRKWIKKRISNLKLKGNKLVQYNSFNELLDFTTSRRFLYLISDYLPIAVLSVIYHFAMKFLSPEAFEKFTALSTSSNAEIAKFTFADLWNVIKAIILPTTASGWMLLGIIVWCSTTYLAGMLFEPFKKGNSLSDTPHFCMFYAKKWSNQISSLAILLTIPEILRDYTGINITLTQYFAKAEIYVLVFGILSFFSFFICMVPIGLSCGIRKLFRRSN